MKLKNIVAMLLLMLTFGALFVGCSKDDVTDNTIGTGEGNADDAGENVDADETVNDILSEDSAEEDVEIGSLI